MTPTTWLLSACALLGAQDPAPTERPPNVVLILADDLGWGDLGCYSEKSRIPTPHLDALAAEGTRFIDAHSPSSVCTPTRYALMTGRYAWRRGLTAGVLLPFDPPLLEDERTTLPELLAGRGYATACVGKWHLGFDWPLTSGGRVSDDFEGLRLTDPLRMRVESNVDWSRPVTGGPLSHGFQTYFGEDVPHFPPYAWMEGERFPVAPTSTHDPTLYGSPGPAAPGWDLTMVLPTLTQRAATEVARLGREGAAPFFLFVSLTAPHTPITPSPPFVGKSRAGAYGDFVTQVDWVVGEVLTALEAAGRAEDTLVLFASDNGSPGRSGDDMSGQVASVTELHGHDPSGPWRGIKADIWEGGHRVPLIARWPGRVEAGRVSDQPFLLHDLYGTLASLAGATVPAGNGEDSFDMTDALVGPEPEAPLRDHLVHHSYYGMLALREGRWKLCFGRGHGGWSPERVPDSGPQGQLYDLEADPEESRNLFDEHPDIVERLTARMRGMIEQGRSTPGSPPTRR